MRSILMASFLAAICAWAAEDGTKDNPLTISSVQELVQFRNAVADSGTYKGVVLKNGGEGLFFKQTTDLDLSSLCGPQIGSWTSIGPFEGSYDGDNHEISNLYIDDSLGHVSNPGFFGTVFNNTQDTIFFENMVFKNAFIRSSGILGTVMTQIVTGKAIVQNNIIELTFKGSSKPQPSEHTSDYQVGGIMGNTVAEWVGFYNNTIKGSFTILGKHDIILGGIIGALVDPGDLIGNVNEADILIDGESYVNLGGLVGQLLYGTKIKNNINKGNITINVGNDYLFVGGLIGVDPSMSIKRQVVGNANYGKIEVSGGKAAEGGIYGLVTGNTNLTLDSCINYGDVIYHGKSQELAQVGGIAGILETKQASRLENKGKIYIENATSPQVGGITGFVRPGAKSLDLTNSINSGDITIKSDSLIQGWISGIIGNTDNLDYVRLDSCTNKGNIVFEGTKDSILFVAALASVPPTTNLNTITSSNEGIVPERAPGRTNINALAKAPKMHLQQLSNGRAILEIPDVHDYSRVQVEMYSYNGKQVSMQQTQVGSSIYLEGFPTGNYIIRAKTPLGAKTFRVRF